MSARTLALVSAILAVGLTPTAAAQDGLWQCNKDPLELVFWLKENIGKIVDVILGKYGDAAGKAKCTVMETLGICSEDKIRVPSGVPASTGSPHPHRSLCREFYVPNQPSPCPQGHYRLHRAESSTPYDPGFHTHSCHPINDL